MPNLVGIGLSQVPTNSMLGGLAYQDPEHASIKDLDLKNLSQINSEISDTATDIFVYDTRKDSDGGAWRKRTQHTSWYNETLGTATRGTRREFPAVAVIVAEQNFIKIYDGDDPDLPMWMVFNTIAGGASQGMADRPMVQLQGVDKVVYALNGILATGTSNEGSNYGQPIINFISEKVLRMDSQGGEGGRWLGNIAQRNEAIGYQSVDYDYVIAASKVNDIAMTVLPNAPIDDATGLPVPTIAVGTDNGPSIIKDDGTVVDLTYQESSNRIVRMIDIDSNGRIYWSTRETGSAPGVYFHEADLPAADSSAEPLVNISTNQAGAVNGVKPTLISGSLRDVVRTKDRTVLSLSGYDNKAHLNLYNVTGDVNSSGSVDNFEMVDISTDYNTGYIIGDIKGVFLSDTDTTNVTGSELITNTDFASDLSGWTNGNPSQFTRVTTNVGGDTDGKLMYYAVDNNLRTFTQYVTCVAGEKYVLSLRACSDTASAMVIDIDGTNVITIDDNNNAAFITKQHTFTAGSTSVRIRIESAAANRSYFTDFSVRLAVEDRSVNKNGLQVFGTVTKSAVATGAELVAYSGWSSSNYLLQPLNSDLAFGNNAFSVMCWFKTSATGSAILIEGDDGSNQKFDLRVHSDEKLLWQVTDDGYSTRSRIYATGPTVVDGAWHCVVGTRTSDNKTHLYLDGSIIGSSTSESAEANLSNSIAFSIGVENAYDGTKQKPWGGSIALARISGTAPSAEQIKKIYEDEKMLFQENAKATLYGSPSNVTAIAYDDSTNLLYAGTAVGRSEFQGLRRINNTTEAVTTAISASNGLVAEQ